MVFGLVITSLGNASVNEWVETKIGEDWYYRICRDSYKTVWFDKLSQTFVEIPYAHAPKIPGAFQKRTEYTRCSPIRTEYTLCGMPFEPQDFWAQPINNQLFYLKDAILECDLLKETNKCREDLSRLISYSAAPLGKPYPAGLEKHFEKKVWQILHKDYDITFYDFVKSLRSMLIPEERLYYAPLIVYFSDKLAPRYEFHYKGPNEWDRVLMEVVKRPSEFEVCQTSVKLCTNEKSNKLLYGTFYFLTF